MRQQHQLVLLLVRQPQQGWHSFQHQCQSLLLQRLLLPCLMTVHSCISSSWEGCT
jgi:hypothetical protein